MCIIIDTNCLASVFDCNDLEHTEYVPVYEWIINGKGKVIYGGSKYLSELQKAKKYLSILKTLRTKSNKVIVVDCQMVDNEQNRIEQIIKNEDFDDPHLPAIVIVSRCRIICSRDKRSIPFVKDKRLYPKGVSIPIFYTKKQNKNILCDNYVDKMYKPLHKENKSVVELIENRINQ